MFNYSKAKPLVLEAVEAVKRRDGEDCKRYLKDDLFKLEHDYKGRSEDQIHETKFKVVPDGKGGYQPQVLSQTGH